MLYDCKRISYWIDRRLTGLAGPDYAATISFGLPLEPEDSQYGKSRLSTSSALSASMPRFRKGMLFPSFEAAPQVNVNSLWYHCDGSATSL